MPNVTASVILHTQRQLKDGTYPIRLRVTHQRQRDYISLDLYATPEDWERIMAPKPKAPHKDTRLLVNAFQKKADDILYDMERVGTPFTFERFERMFTDTGVVMSVFRLYEVVIKELEAENRVGTAISYRNSLHMLKRFRKDKDVQFGEVDHKFLKRFEQFILQAASPTTVGIYMRAFRVMCNRAVKEGVIKQDHYPFNGYTIPTAASAKRALRKVDVQAFYNQQYEPGSQEWKAKNYWFFSYLAQGMNFTDIAYLKYSNITDGRIIYQRTKTRRTAKQAKLLSIKLTPQLREIMDRLGAGGKAPGDYIFPVLTPGLTATAQKATILQFIKTTNKYLDRIGKQLGLPIDLTTYVARHSYATVLKRNGAPTSVISESLGHHNERTTQVYLDSFENEVLDEQNANLL